jgi:hypothetical protein
MGYLLKWLINIVQGHGLDSFCFGQGVVPSLVKAKDLGGVAVSAPIMLSELLIPQCFHIVHSFKTPLM